MASPLAWPLEESPEEDLELLTEELLNEDIQSVDEDEPPAAEEVEITDVQPAGSGDYVVSQGECVVSIAAKFGLFWKTIWFHRDNAELRKLRRDPTLLQPGDRLNIPALEPKWEIAATDQTHQFVLCNTPAKLRLRFCEDGHPLENLPYVLEIETVTREGYTDDDGQIEVFIPPEATSGVITVGEGTDARRYELDLGHLDPEDTISGVQARLHNLGFEPGPIDGVLGAATRNALIRFQKLYDLPESGELDSATKNKLKELHHS